MSQPVICFGQQPNGFFPKRLLIAKIDTAKRLASELGGRVVHFYHDSDHDYRETVTVLKDVEGREERLNFTQENKVQKKYSPLYAKRIPAGWQEEVRRRLPRFVRKEIGDLFASVQAQTAGDFCFQMYAKLGLFEGMEVMRSSDPAFREKASDLTEGFADVTYEGEIVRARWMDGKLSLHQGGDQYLSLPDQPIEKRQKNPHRNNRFAWMQSVIGCTHYVYGKGEAAYMDFSKYPGITFVARDEIADEDDSWIEPLVPLPEPQ